MSNDLNQCNFIGRLGKDPESRFTADGKQITSFSIACGSSWKDKQGNAQEATEWVNCTVFGKLAEIAGKYLVKGSQVYVSGKMKTDKYEKEGVTMYSTKIIVDNFQMLGGKPEGGEKPKAAQKEAPAATDDFSDDIPF